MDAFELKRILQEEKEKLKKARLQPKTEIMEKIEKKLEPSENIKDENTTNDKLKNPTTTIPPLKEKASRDKEQPINLDVKDFDELDIIDCAKPDKYIVLEVCDIC